MEKVKQEISRINKAFPKISKNLRKMKSEITELLNSEESLSKVDMRKVIIARQTVETMLETTKVMLGFGYEKIDVFKGYRFNRHKFRKEC